mmetsp:Transcript_15500/g.52282  ORF Transcript_15500/g.52282 Transcript_15500/m.52282 type:complete len:270 (+) Transcript_15500:88-897(+)
MSPGPQRPRNRLPGCTCIAGTEGDARARARERQAGVELARAYGAAAGRAPRAPPAPARRPPPPHSARCVCLEPGPPARGPGSELAGERRARGAPRRREAQQLLGTGQLVLHGEGDAPGLEAVNERWPKGRGGGQHAAVRGREPRALRGQREAEGGLGDHLGGLRVARVAPAHRGEHPLAVLCGRRKRKFKPGCLADLLRGPLARGREAPAVDHGPALLRRGEAPGEVPRHPLVLADGHLGVGRVVAQHRARQARCRSRAEHIHGAPREC